MSTAPFDTGLVIARLEPLLDEEESIRKIGGSADLAAVANLADFPAPCAYVYLVHERGKETSSGTCFPGQQTALAQVMEVTVAVVMAFRNYRQITDSDELRNELAHQVGAVRGRLLGWTPKLQGARALQLDRGDLTAFDAGVAVWTDVWRTQHAIKPKKTENT